MNSAAIPLPKRALTTEARPRLAWLLALLSLVLFMSSSLAHAGHSHTKASVGADPLSAHGYVQYQYLHRSYNVERCQTCLRDSRGRILRNPQARRQFRSAHPCPATGKTVGACPGYVVDHIQALKRGGADTPANMQWQTTAAAKAKDRWE